MEAIKASRKLVNEYLACCLSMTMDIVDCNIGAYNPDSSEYSQRVSAFAKELNNRV